MKLAKLNNINGILIYPHELDDKKEEKIKKIKKLGFNSVFYVVKNYDGKVFYQSLIAETVRDTLGSLCKICNSLSINVFAWFCLFVEGYIGKLRAHGISKFLEENPEVSAVNINGKSTINFPVSSDYGLENYVCPANKKVQNYEINLINEVLEKYPISGIHLDFIRYPFPGEYCYCGYCRKLFFEKSGGRDLYKITRREHRVWKEEIITNFVSRVYIETRKIKKVSLSALVWKYPECLSKNQNWATWNIDFVTPMFYHRFHLKKLDWIERAINKNLSYAGNRFIPAVGGVDSSNITQKEWYEILNKVYNKGFLVGHYGLEEVLRTMEKESYFDFFKKSVKGNLTKTYFFMRKMLERAR